MKRVGISLIMLLVLAVSLFPLTALAVNYRDFIITYDLNLPSDIDGFNDGGTPTTAQSVSLESATTDGIQYWRFKMPNYSPSASNYKFAGWTINGGNMYSDPGGSYNISTTSPGTQVFLHSLNETTAERSFVAQWEKYYTYSMDFRANFTPGSGESFFIPADAVTQVVGTTSIALTLPTPEYVRPGYAFSYWCMYATGGGYTQYYPGENTIGVDGSSSTTVTLYARWAQEYRLKYDLNGGTGSISDTVATQGLGVASWCKLDVTKDAPSRDGYKFLGWADTADAETPNVKTETVTVYAESSSSPGGIKTLYAVWEKLNTLQFNGNKPDSALTVTGLPSPVWGENSVTIPDQSPALSGGSAYNFLGWATSATGDAVYQPGDEYTLSGDTELFAVWERVYRLRFDTNGGDADSPCPPEQTGTTALNSTSKSFTIPADIIPTREGYRFLGWATASDAAAPDVTDSVTVSHSTDGGTEVLYALWQEPSTLQFNGNKPDSALTVTGLPSPICGEDSVTIPDQHPSLSGGSSAYSFLGWATSATGDAVCQPGDEYTLSGDAELFAVWERVYRLRFDTNGGDADSPCPPEQTGTTALNSTSKSFTIPADIIPTREGYRFLGWATASDAAAPDVTDSVTVSHSTDGGTEVLYALWKTHPILSFDDGSSEGDVTGMPAEPSKTAPYNSSVTLPDAPARTGYSFEGWEADDGVCHAADASYTVPDRDVSFTALWLRNIHNITWLPGGEGVSGLPEGPTTSPFGLPIEEYPVPSRSGYKFLGWSPDGGENLLPEDFTMPDEDIELTAVWEALPVPPTEYDESDELLQTGQLRWPIPVLCLLGLGMIAGGLSLLAERKKGKHEN